MDVRERALGIIAEISGKEVAEVAPHHALVGDLGIDSPKALQLLVQIEETLGIEISDEEAARMDSVKDILAFLEQRS